MSQEKDTMIKRTAPMIPTIIMIAVTNFAAMMNTTSVTILLPVFMREFQTDIILTQWVVTAYMLATCIVAPIVGYISDRISLKKAFIAALVGFSVCNMLLGMAGSIYMVIAMRVLQGIFGGMLMPITQSMIYQYFPRAQQAQAVSIWATTNLLAPTLAPSIAGAISDILSWRWIFYVTVPILIAVIAVALKLLPSRPDEEKPEQHAFDFSGLILSTIGSLSLLMAFSNITVWGLTSAPVIGLTLAGLLTLAAFFYIEHKKQHPMLQVKVFGYEGYLSSVVLMCIGSIFINASNNVIPIFLQDIRGFSTTQAALMMLPAPLVIMFIVPLMGKYYDRIGPQKMLTAVLCVGIIACLANGMIGLESSVIFIVIALILRDMGAGTFNMPATNMGMQAVPVQYSTHAAAMTSWARQCVVSLAIGLVNTFQTARTKYYVSTDVHGDYNHCYADAMSDLFHIIILCYLVGFVAVYFSKSRKKA
ncbi:MAG: DHA2 family efflux MFS transporter permease subunit [Peptococcaceae bacterium]|nr:DHA2 family efflux MFS transporter permease subunit [Peptococcaceae bacterium]